MRASIVCVLLLAMPARADAPARLHRLDGSTISTADVDATVARLMRAARVPGVALALFDGGRVVYEKAYGARDVARNLPLTVDSVMTGASFSKTIVAHLALQLVQQGRLDLDRPIARYLPRPLPQYPRYRDLAGDERWRLLTARMLLDHTSGFPNLRVFNDDRKLNINFTPGTRYAYSGEGIELLQLVIEEITHQPLEQLAQARLFVPLGMQRSSMVWQPRFADDFAGGYDEYGRPLEHERRDVADGAGSLQTTLRDFARFVQSIAQHEILSAATIDLMLSPQIAIDSKHEFPTLKYERTDANKAIRLSYGLGWGLYFTPVGKAWFKEGHTDGFRNYAVMFDRGIGIVIMTNSGNGEGIYKELLETLLADTYTPIEWEGFTPYDKLPRR